MNKSLEQLCKSLESLSSSILSGWTGNQTFTDAWGWNCLPMTRHELAKIPADLAKRIKENGSNEIEPSLQKVIETLPAKIKTLESQTVPYLYNGHNVQSVQVILSFLEWINIILQPILGWTLLAESKAMPAALARRLKSTQSQLESIIIEKEELERQIQLIKSATDAAEALPTDLESLKDARKKIDSLHGEAAALFGKIDTLHTDSMENSKFLKDKKDEADKLVSQCEEAYKITTSKGLAGAFDERAKKLTNSMWIWVSVLVLTLTAGSIISSFRIDALLKALTNPEPNMVLVWINSVLSLLSLGAPIWLAWIATKQISQRFKLAEDYSFKSALAKAYEGYRKEAARIDPTLESRLFGSALTRLEEAPLRVMEENNYGSPWHELLNSQEFKKAMKEVPEFKEKLIALAKGKKNPEKQTEKTE